MAEHSGMTKVELVRYYIPNASDKTVGGWFKRNVHSNPKLMQLLRAVGYRKTTRTLTGEMVDLIVKRYVVTENNEESDDKTDQSGRDGI